MNSRETLAHIADWLGWQDETLSSGLHNSFDALRLYDYWQTHENRLDEAADEWESSERVAALGYDPMFDGDCEAVTAGTAVAVSALLRARELLDSVTYVAEEGDTKSALVLIDKALGGS